MDTLALIKEKYQGFIPAHARTRLEEELELVAESSTPLFFELIGRIVKAAFANGGEAMTTGNVSSSFLAYLLGAHNVNPLPPHYFCPICGRLELVPEAKSGFDLEEKICCSKPMIRDGHGLSASIYKPFFKDSSIFSLRVSDNVAALAGEMVEEFYSLHPEIERSENDEPAETILPAAFDDHARPVIDKPKGDQQDNARRFAPQIEKQAYGKKNGVAEGSGKLFFRMRRKGNSASRIVEQE